MGLAVNAIRKVNEKKFLNERRELQHTKNLVPRTFVTNVSFWLKNLPVTNYVYTLYFFCGKILSYECQKKVPEKSMLCCESYWL